MSNTEEEIIESTNIETTDSSVVSMTPQAEIEEVKEIKTAEKIVEVPKEPEIKLSFIEKMKLFTAKAKEMGEKAGSLKDKAKEMGEKATEMAKSFTGKAKETVETVKEKGVETMEQAKVIKDTATEKFEEAKEKTAETVEKAKETKDSITEKVENTVESMKEKGSETIDKVTEIKDNASEKLEEVKEKAIEIKEDIVSKPVQETLVEKPKSFFERAKEMATKTMETGTNLLEKIVPYMKTADEYEKIKDEKILAILFIKKDEAESKKILFKMPLIMKAVWANGVNFKVVDIDELLEFADKLDIDKVPSLLVFEKGDEKKRTTDIEEISKYLKDFIV